MKLPKLLRKLWLPILAILILILIATLEERESFVAAGPGRISRPAPPPKVPAASSMEQQAATNMSRQEQPPNTIRGSTTGPERRTA